MNRSIHSSLAISTSSKPRHGLHGWITSDLTKKRPVSACDPRARASPADPHRRSSHRPAYRRSAQSSTAIVAAFPSRSSISWKLPRWKPSAQDGVATARGLIGRLDHGPQDQSMRSRSCRASKPSKNEASWKSKRFRSLPRDGVASPSTTITFHISTSATNAFKPTRASAAV